MSTGGPCADHSQPRVYIAAPIFTPAQLAAVGAVVDVAEMAGYVTYSPSRDGVMLKPTDPPERRDEVWFSNVIAIRQCDLLICIMDVKDTGTIWELGVAAGRDLPVVAVTLDIPLMNVMLERGVWAHVRTLTALEIVLDQLLPLLSFGAKQTEDHRLEFGATLRRLKAIYSYTGGTQ